MYEQTARLLNQPLTPSILEMLCVDGRAFLETQEASLHAAIAAGEDPERVDPRTLLRSAMDTLKLKLPAEAMFTLGRDDNFEIWSIDRKLLACGNRTLVRMSYPIYDWFQQDWSELFVREKQYEEKIVKAWSSLSPSLPVITNVCEHHVVKEKGARERAAWVQVKTVSLAFSLTTGEPCAAIGITNIQDVPMHSRRGPASYSLSN